MARMERLLIRHGESERVDKGTPIAAAHVSPLGIRTAQRVGRQLRAHGVTSSHQVASSPSLRSVETVEHAGFNPFKVTLLPELLEIESTQAEKARHRELMKRGELPEDLAVLPCVEGLLAQPPSQEAFFTHGRKIFVILAMLGQRPFVPDFGQIVPVDF